MAKKSSAENKSIRNTMMDVMTEFYEQVIFPHFDGRLVPIEKDMAQIKGDVKGLKEGMDDVQRKLDQNQKEHDKMFVRLDKNDKEHKKMFAKLDIIEDKVDGHEPRIKRLEKTLQAA